MSTVENRGFAAEWRRIPLGVWLIGLGSLLNVGGLSLLWPVNSIYIHTVLGRPMTVAGFILMVYSGCGFVGSLLGGWLYDRIGGISVLAIGLATSAFVIMFPLWFHSWGAYVAVMAVFGTACAIPFPALNALVGQAWPGGGRQAYNFVYVANNLGVAAGTAIGGVLAEWSFSAVFIAIAVAYTVFLAFSLTVLRSQLARVQYSSVDFDDVIDADKHAATAVGLEDDSSEKHSSATGTTLENPRTTDTAARWWGIACVLGGYALCWTIYVQFQSIVSVYMQSLGFALAAYSVLWTLNGLLIFITQPLVTVVVRLQPSLGRQMAAGAVLFALGFAVLFFSSAYPVFILAMVILTLGEIFAWPAVPAAIARLSPPNRMGTLQGLVGSAATFGRMIGPVIGGALYDMGSMHAVLIAVVIGAALPLALFLGFSGLHRETGIV